MFRPGSTEANTRLIIGCGYLGREVARLWIAQGRTVYGLVRSNQQAKLLSARAVRPIVADILCPHTLHHLPTAEVVLFCVGYDRTCRAGPRQLFVEGLENVLAAIRVPPRRFVLASTTGVFGKPVDGWVDEHTPPAPVRPTAQALLAAERLLRLHPVGARSVVLRLAGLYGPNRLPGLHHVKAGRPLTKDPDALLNLIHVTDAASVVLACDRVATPPELLLVSDGAPVRRRDFYERLAQLLGAARPKFLLSPAGAQRAVSKQIRNHLMQSMLASLGMSLRYPTYREGLRSIVEPPGYEDP